LARSGRCYSWLTAMKKVTKPAPISSKKAPPKPAKKPVKGASPVRKSSARAAASKAAVKAKPRGLEAKAPPAPGPVPPAPDPLQEYESAAKLFRAGNFKEAKKLFDQIGESPVREVAHAARLHSRMCEQRLGKPAVRLSTAEDYYNYGVALINQRNLEEARSQLLSALKISPEADHVHYALALCLGLKGDLEGSASSLRRAIELQPRNRVLARNDPDFMEISRRPPLNELLAR